MGPAHPRGPHLKDERRCRRISIAAPSFIRLEATAAQWYRAPVSRNKTQPEPSSASALVASVADAQRRADSLQLLELMRTATGMEPMVWGSSIIGYGTHHYKYDSGREGDTVAVGFAPRAQAIVLYGLGSDGQNPDLGTISPGKGCLYVKRLADVNVDVLEGMIRTAFTARHNVRPQSAMRPRV